jgi:hypothetical protein
MSFYAVPSTYNSLLGAEDVPATMLPSTQAKMIPCASQLKSVRTQSASLTPGALALWQIQTGAGTGYLKAGSLYLRGTLTLTVSAAAGTWRFSGPRQGFVGEGQGLNTGTHSASALISRLTVSNGAQQLSQLTNYNVWHDLLLTHATSADYAKNDSLQYEFTGVTRGVANPATDNERTINFAIPLMSPLFNGQQSIPLFLLNSPLSVELLFNSIADAFVADTITVSNYVISNAEICYEEIAVSPELKQSIMNRLQGGAMWKQYMDSVYSIQTAALQNDSYNIGVGVTSCKGVIGVDRNPSAIGVGFTGDFMLNGFNNVQIRYDGKLINNYDITTDASAFAELNRALHSMYDSNITSCLSNDASAAAGNNPWSDYVVSKFAWGVSSQAVNDSTVGFSGSPVQMITVQHYNATAANAAAFPYVNEAFVAARQRVYFVLYDEMLTIDANGVCSLIR